MPTLKDGSVISDKRLDRLVQFDSMSRQFAAVDVIFTRKHRAYTWRPGPGLDQGNEGACVGYALTHDLMARPVRVAGLDGKFARDRIYHEAQRLDPWEGGSYESASPFYEGTSILAGLKAVRALGYIGGFRWAFGLNDVRLALGYSGPVVFGLNWYEGMATPYPDGRIKPTGRLLGGHAILGYKNDERNARVCLVNSWGADWGIVGSCYLTYDDLETLLYQQGEAAIATDRKLTEGSAR